MDEAQKGERMSNILELEHVTKKYGSVTALDDVSLRLESGRIVGLLGPNGSGKTTLIRLAMGMRKLTSGEIYVSGGKPGRESRAVTSYLADHSTLPDWMKVREAIGLYGDMFSDFDRKRAESMAADLNINMNDRISSLSKGMKDKLYLILAMCRRAELYLLDEPIAGVDPAARDYILKTILSNYEKDALVVISTHLIADVESILDEVIFLKNGKVLFHENADKVRSETGMSIDAYFREVYAQ